MRTHVALAFAAVISLAAASAGAQEAEPVKRYPPSSVRPKLVAGGLAVTGLAYGAGFLAATSWPEVPGSEQLKIPVVGPWLALAKNDCAPDDPDCGFILYFRGFLTIVDGLMQLGGLGIAGEGLFMTTEASPRRQGPPTLSIRPVPMVAASSAGVGVVGTF